VLTARRLAAGNAGAAGLPLWPLLTELVPWSLGKKLAQAKA
jgi:hypothetical protein